MVPSTGPAQRTRAKTKLSKMAAVKWIERPVFRFACFLLLGYPYSRSQPNLNTTPLVLFSFQESLSKLIWVSALESTPHQNKIWHTGSKWPGLAHETTALMISHIFKNMFYILTCFF